VEFAYKTAKYHVIPKIAALLGMGGFFGYGIKRIMDGVSEYDVTNYHIIPIGLTKSGRSVYLRIPQDEYGRLIGGLMYKTMGATLKAAMPDRYGKQKPSYGLDLINYLGGEIPSASPLIGAMMDVGSYMSGNVPYDYFRGRPAYSKMVGEAGGKREFKEFAKYMSNQMGGGIVHRFKGEDRHEIELQIEKWIAIPALSNIIGRWIKVSDYGITEKIREEAKDPYRQEAAERKLTARDAFRKMVSGEYDQTTEAEKDAFMEEWPNIKNSFMEKLLNRRYGNALMNELTTARNDEERMRIWDWVTEHERKLKAEGMD
jgi:hypothetical protein